MSSCACPSISVIVVNFNSGPFLGLCIERIRKSNIAVELIVVDNHSKDISKLWTLGCNGESTEKYIRNELNLGFSAAVNIGATVASGDILVVINPDCLVWPHTIDLLCRSLNDDQEIGLVGGLVFGIYGREQSGCRRYDVTPIRSIGKMLGKLLTIKNLPTIDMTQEPIPEASIDVDAVSGSFFAVRRSLYDELGGLDEDYFLHFEDLDFCRRVRRAGYRVVFNPDVSVIHVGAVSSRVKSVEIARYKHHSLSLYFKKHLNRYSVAACIVLVMSQLYVWLRCLHDSIEPEKQHNYCSDRFEEIWGMTNADEVFVIGDQNQLLFSVVKRLAAGGYSVVVETDDPHAAPKIPRVTWIDSEYSRKLPQNDQPKSTYVVCLGSAEQLRHYRNHFVLQNCDSQLLVETGVRDHVVIQSGAIESAVVVVETNGSWLQRSSLCFRLMSDSDSLGSQDKHHIINDLGDLQSPDEEYKGSIDNYEKIHVDDISELCFDVLVRISGQEPEANSQQILKDAVDRFNRRIRPLYN